MIALLEKYRETVESACTIRVEGEVSRVVGTIIEGRGPAMPLGGICRVLPGRTLDPIMTEVVGFREGRLLLMPLGNCEGLQPGSTILADRYQAKVGAGRDMLGRVVDGMGGPLDHGPPLRPVREMPLYAQPHNPLQRSRIHEPLDVGVRAINCLITLAKGQRTAI
ncbi:MAG: EscN/YscN/HrcN family type III secretion system ATPase, partial [Deltaproteobacteria bacterium]|nr:EscN/YscN/HrcN family type III secretion system ATPase [Deltaproteobacteria bacterium]